MRCGWLRNAACHDSTEIPLLPFLAPRVFAPWPGNRAPQRSSFPVPINRAFGHQSTCAREALPYACAPQRGSTVAKVGVRRGHRRARNYTIPAGSSSGKLSRSLDNHASTPLEILSQHRSEHLPRPSGVRRIPTCRVKVTKVANAATFPSQSRLYSTGLSPRNSTNHEEITKPPTQSQEFEVESDARPNQRRTPHFAVGAVETVLAGHRTRIGLRRWRRRFRKYGKPVKRVSLRVRHPPSVKAGDGGTTASIELARFSKIWMANFAILNSKYDNGVLKATDAHVVRVHPDVEAWIHNFLKYGPDANSMRRAYEELDIRIRLRRWPYLMFWMLENSPASALAALVATSIDPMPPPYAVADSLEYLTSFHLQHVEKYDESLPAQVVQEFLEFFDSAVQAGYPITQKTMYLIATRANANQLEVFEDLLRSKRISVEWSTLLHFAYAYATHGQYRHAVVSLHKAADLGGNLKSDAFLSTCSGILRKTAQIHRDPEVNYEVVGQTLKTGVGLNRVYCNTIILAAVEAGDVDTGIRVYEFMDKIQTPPDEYTYGMLLKGCKLSGNYDSLELLMKHAISRGIDRKDRWIPAEFLHCVYLYHARNETPNLYERLLSTYAEFFDLQPLIDLELVPALQPAADTKRELHPPPPSALGIMICAYLSLRDAERVGPSVTRLYGSFRIAVEDGHELISPLTTTDHVYNAFLRAFGRDPATLKLCTYVLRHMGTGSIGATTGPDGVRRTLRQATPTVQTWSILVHAFMRHGQHAAAEKVLTLMRQRGLEPNVVTWNSIVGNYAAQQRLDKTVDVLRRMQAAGVPTDDITLSGLVKLKNRRGLAEALQRDREPSVEDFAQMGYGTVGDDKSPSAIFRSLTGY